MVGLLMLYQANITNKAQGLQAVGILITPGPEAKVCAARKAVGRFNRTAEQGRVRKGGISNEEAAGTALQEARKEAARELAEDITRNFMGSAGMMRVRSVRDTIAAVQAHRGNAASSDAINSLSESVTGTILKAGRGRRTPCGTVRAYLVENRRRQEWV